MRHEDYPCCGCGPEGCIDTSRLVECADCGRPYYPDQWTEVYCYRCQDGEAFGASEDWVDDSDYDGDPGPDYDDLHGDEESCNEY